VESLIVQTAALWPGNSADDPDARAMGIAPSILRFSVGLEKIDDLIADMDQAL
jgi:cystathionine beta-lyase/cystathionine gamma-synthase